MHMQEIMKKLIPKTMKPEFLTSIGSSYHMQLYAEIVGTFVIEAIFYISTRTAEVSRPGQESNWQKS